MKIVWLLMFAAFASVSCWATAESLHLLLESWPVVFCYIVAIGFFLIDSLGTKLVSDSLNSKVYVESRKAKLWGGLLLFLIFWLVCSMPTNTHTFFYRENIGKITSSDISTTRGYLAQISGNIGNQANQKINILQTDIQNLLTNLKNQIFSPGERGIGPKSMSILSDIANKLNTQPFTKLTPKGTRDKDLQDVYNAYAGMVHNCLQNEINRINNSVVKPNPVNLATATSADQNLAKLDADIKNGAVNLNDAIHMNAVCQLMDNGYSAVKLNSNFVTFNPQSDAARYTAINPVTKVSRLKSVVDAWSDYIGGKFEGNSFLFWIVISVLVDIAAFIFFDLAFKKEE